MHRRWLYKRVHGWHHRIVTPWAITGNYMHPIEFTATASVALIGPMLVGAHVARSGCGSRSGRGRPPKATRGYDLPWTPTHLLPFNDGALTTMATTSA